MTETNRVEYKGELNIDLDIEKEVIAFLNYHEKGMIYSGIDKAGKVIGVTHSEVILRGGLVGELVESDRTGHWEFIERSGGII